MTLKECFIHAQNTQDPLDSSEQMLSVMWRTSRGLKTLCATARSEGEIDLLQRMEKAASRKQHRRMELLHDDFEAKDWAHTLIKAKHLKSYASYAGTCREGVQIVLWRVDFRKPWQRRVEQLCEGRRLLPYARKDAAKQVFEKA